jgi:hypothetical protein
MIAWPPGLVAQFAMVRHWPAVRKLLSVALKVQLLADGHGTSVS